LFKQRQEEEALRIFGSWLTRSLKKRGISNGEERIEEMERLARERRSRVISI
jgi:hypothetical protein